MSNREISVDELSDNELAYEADIRDVDLNDSVAIIKRNLRAKFRDERSGLPIPMRSKVPLKEDIDGCISKF